MTPADKIRQMTDEELNKFLWGLKINSITQFLDKGGAGLMNAYDQRIWLQSEDPEWTGEFKPWPEEDGN